MAGHSKWANIKHKKAKIDAKRGKVFTKLIREITVAAKISGDPASNPRLRDAIANAKSQNMTNDTIQKAVDKGAGNAVGDDLQEITYEGYGPAGVAILVECMTDNRNRTVSEVRHAFTKAGGNLGTDGSVNYLFTKQGQLLFEPGVDEEALMEVALEAGADDINNFDDGSAEVITSPEQYVAIKEAIVAASFEPVQAEIAMIPSTSVDISDAETAEKVNRMIDALEDLDDVQNVFHNADIDPALEG